MKKSIIMALAVLASASFCTVSAAKKDKKKKQEVAAVQLVPELEQPVVLVTPSDTMSYATGMGLTDGLIPFLQQQYGVDEAFMDDFLLGFEEAFRSNVGDPIKAYSAGIQIANMVKTRMIPGVSEEMSGMNDSIQADLLKKGFVAAIRKDSTHFTTAAATKFYRDRMEAVKHQKEEAAKKVGRDWLAENARKEGVVTTPSGLQYKIITAGTGEIPVAEDEVTVKYEGKLIDGTVFDSSYTRNPQTSNFKANQVIKGWTEALTMMPVGSKWELYIPEDLAYGSRPAGKIPPYSTLIFTVELEGVKKAEAEKPAEEPVKVQPKKTVKKKAKK